MTAIFWTKQLNMLVMGRSWMARPRPRPCGGRWLLPWSCRAWRPDLGHRDLWRRPWRHGLVNIKRWYTKHVETWNNPNSQHLWFTTVGWWWILENSGFKCCWTAIFLQVVSLLENMKQELVAEGEHEQKKFEKCLACVLETFSKTYCNLCWLSGISSG